jgi:pimeloyl-ACP methyl ester carboxylesterase
MNKLIIIILLALFVFNQNLAQEGSYANVNGVKIYYEIYGDGEPLVLLHGFTLSHEMWNPFVDDLLEEYQLIIVDLRGHGHSTNPSNYFRHKESARDIYGLMDTLGIKKFKAMGFSSGGMTLIHMATMDTSRIQDMVLISSSNYYTDSGRNIQRSITYESAKKNKTWMKNMKKWQPGGEAQIKSLLSQFQEFANTYEDMNFTPPYLGSIRANTLVILGDSDPFFQVDIAVNMYKSIPNSYLWIVPNYAHYIMSRHPLLSASLPGVVKRFFSGEWSK